MKFTVFWNVIMHAENYQILCYIDILYNMKEFK